MKKGSPFAVCLVLILTIFIGIDMHFELSHPVRGTVVYVGGTGGGNYSTIQEGVDAANLGDTVFVYNGTYHENIIVNKAISLVGEDRETTLVDGSENGDVIQITTDWVNISGFTTIKSGTMVGGNAGIGIRDADNCKIDNTNCSYNLIGIFLYSSNNNKILNNSVFSNNGIGIFVDISKNNEINGNNCTYNEWGISIDIISEYNIIKNNFISHNTGGHGIFIRNSNFNIIDNNICSYNSYDGIHLADSDGNFIINNSFTHSSKYHMYFHDSNYNIVINNVFSYSIYSVFMSLSNENYIGSNLISNSECGIYLIASSTINITNNSMEGNGIYINQGILENWNTHYIDTLNKVNSKPVYYWKNIIGGTVPSDAGEVILANCRRINISSCNPNYGTVGILMGFSDKNQIYWNNVSWNKWYGIYLYASDNNAIFNNTESWNIKAGIFLSFSVNNNLTFNEMAGDGIWIEGSLKDWNTHDIDTSNTANERPVYYLKNQSQRTIPLSVGQVILANSTEITIEKQDLSRCSIGIQLGYSSNNNITLNIISSNYYGIYLSESSNNHIHHNNFVNNSDQAYDDRWDNYWDAGYPTGGNHWSDYDGIDLNSTSAQDVPPPDGIGDTPYVIDSDSLDNYPLMGPMGNITILRHGWNQISIPRIQNSTNLEDVLSQINGSYRAVQWFNASDKQDPWKHYSTLKPSYMNDLDKIDHTMGFQIYIDEPGGAILDFEGLIPSQNQTIPLHKGWNMVGYPSLSNKYRPDALKNLVFGTEVDAVWTYNTSSQTWQEIGPSDYFELGRGYWVHATQDCIWEVPL